MKNMFKNFSQKHTTSPVSLKGMLSLFLTLMVLLSCFAMIPVSAENVWGVENYPIMVGYTEKTKPTSKNWSFGIADYSSESRFAISTDGFAAPVATFNADDALETFTWNEISGADSYKIDIYKGSACVASETVANTEYTTGYGVIIGVENYLAQVKAMKGGKAIAKSEICSFTATAGTASTGYPQTATDKTVYVADGYTSGTSALTNADTGAGYTFINNNSDREVVFNAVSESGKMYGTYLTFTAPEDGLYDFLGNVRIRDNASAKKVGTLYFRVVKIDSENKESVIYPLDGSWMSIESSDVFPEPYLDKVAPQADLKKNEKAVLQAYFDGAGKINIGLSNMSAIRQQSEVSYKGEITEYPFKDYTPHFMFDGTTNGIRHLEGRWTANIFSQTEANGYQEQEYGSIDSYKLLHYNFGSNRKVGYYFYTDDATKPLKMKVGYGGYGMSYNFTSPTEGKISISAVLGNASTDYQKYRIVHNGVTVFPENGGWESVTSREPSINVSVDAMAGDIVQFQYYSSYASGDQLPVLKTLTAGISTGNDSNSVDGTVFSPLWERPWDGKDYNGDFAFMTGSVWNLDFFEATSGGHVKGYKTGNKFNSTTGVLTYIDPDDKNEGCEDTEYVFTKKELKVNLTKKQSGASVLFVTPTRGNYDLSAAIKILKGEGQAFVRVLKNDKLIYPNTQSVTEPWNVWKEFKTSLDLDSLEISAMAGDKIRLEVYGTKSDWTEPMVISLGTPVIHKLSNRQGTATGNISVYKPYDYVAFEKGYSGEYTRGNSRFNYYFTPADGSKTAVNKSNSAKNQLSLDNNSVTIKEDATTLNIKAGTTAEIEFIAPADASGELQAIAEKSSGNAQFAIYKGTEEITAYSDTIAENTNVDLAKGDQFSIRVKATTDAEIKFTTLNLKLGGKHYNQNSASDDGFYALYSEPYDDDNYTGTFTQSESMYWNFNGYKVSTDTIVSADKYDGGTKKISATEVDTSYTFGNPYLTADFSTDDTGIALGFTAPRADTFAFRSGFRLTTSTTADIKAKLIKISADGNSKTQLWPAEENEWYTQSLEANKDLTIPYINAEMAVGDKLYLLAYAENTSAAKLTVNLVSPSVNKDIVQDYSNVDIWASLYQAWNYSPYTPLYPYSNADYIPMENRWNFEMTEISDTNEITDVLHPSYIINTGSMDELIYKPMTGWPKYQIRSNVNGSIVIDATRNIGSQMRFVAPNSGEISILASPNFTIPEGITINYRIIHKKSDNSQETIWPKTGSWEPLNKANSVSLAQNLSLEVVAGEEIWLQSYIVRDDAANELISTSQRISVNMSMSPVAVVTNSITEGKSNFSAEAGFSYDLQLSPYWKYEYAVDADNPTWQPATRWAWSYWLSPVHTYMGISSGSKMWIASKIDNSTTGLTPAVCYKYTPREDGFIKMSSSKGAVYIGDNKIDGRVRITKNGENVYPSTGWADVPANFKGVEFEVAKGDEVRFEFAVKNPLNSNEELYVSWNPTFTQNKYANYYNISDDIYTYLDDAMLKTFKAMKGNTGFDQDPEASKKLSEEVAKRKETAALLGAMDDIEDDNGYTPDNNEGYYGTEGTPGTEGDYREWTEELYTPGGGYKKIIRTYTTMWWVWLIIGIAVAVVIAVIIVLLILNKKGKIHLFRKKSKTKV